MFFLEYEATEDNQTKFLAFEDGRYVHCQFLKDIHHSVRINHKPKEYRTRDEFLKLFHTKYKESIDRNISKQEAKKADLDSRFDSMLQRLKTYNDKINHDH